MANDIENWAWDTWADELNAALHPLGFLLDGAEAATILEPLKDRSLLARVRAATGDNVLQFTQAANRFLETDTITPAHIRGALERTKWHYKDA